MRIRLLWLAILICGAAFGQPPTVKVDRWPSVDPSQYNYLLTFHQDNTQTIAVVGEATCRHKNGAMERSVAFLALWNMSRDARWIVYCSAPSTVLISAFEVTGVGERLIVNPPVTEVIE